MQSFDVVRNMMTRCEKATLGLIEDMRDAPLTEADVEALLRGTVVTQGRRCGKETCRCASGQLHGPYTYLSVPRPGRRPRLVYVPAALAQTVSGQVAVAARVEAVLAEITAINTELLARRAPG